MLEIFNLQGNKNFHSATINLKANNYGRLPAQV